MQPQNFNILSKLKERLLWQRRKSLLGAGGAIGQHVIEFLQKDENIELTLFARNFFFVTCTLT
jgi:hypothetical protein